MDILRVSEQVVIEHEVKLVIAGFLALCRFQGRLQELALERARLVAEIVQRQPVARYVQESLVQLDVVRSGVDEAVAFSARSEYPTPEGTGERVKTIGFYAVRAEGALYCCSCHSFWLAELLTEHDIHLERDRVLSSGGLLRCVLCGKPL